mgnify:FL=1|tara:strand:+ start:1433 stop:2410 length:978 start_codon:yes stop_codon:yes gene_type:complete
MNNKIIQELLKNKKKDIKDSKILCIGDIILDRYVYGRIDRVSPEAPVPILLVTSEKYQLGGVGNVAKNISSLGGRPSIFYLSSNNDVSKKINGLIKCEKNIKRIEAKVNAFKAPVKTRYINKSSHIIRVDDENCDFKLSKKSQEYILKRLELEIKKYNIIILSDYNKGFLSKKIIQQIIKISKKYGKMVIGDPKKNDLSIYSNIDLLTPNQKEITASSKKKFLSEEDIIKFSRKLIKDNKIQELLVTRSENGMLLVNSSDTYKINASAKKVNDVTGAGDTVVGTLALMLSIGLSMYDSVSIANYAAGLVVEKYGTESLTYRDIVN